MNPLQVKYDELRVSHAFEVKGGDVLDEHGNVDARNGDVLEDIHYKQDISMILLSKKQITSLLGTIGSFAPFHSQIQNSETTKHPEMRVASTIAELQGNVTPPWKRVH